MRKCSKVVHHSLSELNITPLLDLAFVLLVIFIITTTPIVNDLSLNLPVATQKPKEPPRKANYVTVDATGAIHLNKRAVTLDALLQELVQLRVDDPDLSVVVRGDSKTKYRYIVSVMDALQQANVVKVDLATEPLARK
ncbi:MAG TPA: biopolymer transporter ExbD [Verrucomicrobiae bacterium]|nr:biopolymer transporter ExbD [Verrucomicrobiae bacterium]